MATNLKSIEAQPKGEIAAEFNKISGKRVTLQKILVPLDFSDCSTKALEYAITFARGFKADLILLHVVEPYVPYPEMTAVDAALLQAESRDYADEELRKLQKSILSEAGCTTLLREGKPHRIIVDVAREAGVDLIVISTHGRSGLGRLILGSTTERVVRQANCPVLVVRENEHEFISQNQPIDPAR